MTTPKCVVCTCEDVTLDEVLDAAREGYADLESLKRYTGLATGPCQGKACVALAQRVLARELAQPPGVSGTITFRPPLQPIPLRFLAGNGSGVDTAHPVPPGGSLQERVEKGEEDA